MALLRKDEYEQAKADLERSRQLLLSQFADEQDVIPELRSMNGFQFKHLDNKLLAQLAELEVRWRMTKFVVSQRKGTSSRREEETGIPTWRRVQENVAKAYMQLTPTDGGKVVRGTGEGKNRYWEVLE